jgi:hypothetical protein
VPQSLSTEVRECYTHAEECARQAATQSDPTLRRDFLDLEQRWLKLAHSYEFAARVGAFADYLGPSKF